MGRNKRSAEPTTGILQPDEDDFMEFLDDVDDFKEGMATKLGNLTCVLTEMKMLTPELKVDIEESIPSQALAKSPLSRVFGRQMIFFKCAKKNEKLNCAMGQLKKWVEEWYGSGENISYSEYGLPEDEYEASALSAMVLHNAASEEEKFVNEFFWGG